MKVTHDKLAELISFYGEVQKLDENGKTTIGELTTAALVELQYLRKLEPYVEHRADDWCDGNECCCGLDKILEDDPCRS